MRQEPVIKKKTLKAQYRSERPWDVVEILPSAHQIERASKIGLKKKLAGSITKGGGTFIGTLGEIVVADFMELPLINDGNKWEPHYDLRHPEWGKVDVKSKRQNGDALYSGYDVSVWDASRERQHCDYYLFTRVRLRLEEERADNFTRCIVWLLGIYPKEEYFKTATFIPKGSKDPKNGYVCRDACWNLANYLLEPLPNSLLESLETHAPVTRSVPDDIWNFD